MEGFGKTGRREGRGRYAGHTEVTFLGSREAVEAGLKLGEGRRPPRCWRQRSGDGQKAKEAWIAGISVGVTDAAVEPSGATAFQA